jgi:hypothetical protein
MFANFADLLSTTTKKAGATPTKARVSESPRSYKANLKLITELKAKKTGKRKVAALSEAVTPTKRTKTSRTVGKQLPNIDERSDKEDITYSLPLAGRGKDGDEATREELDNAIS